MGSFAQEASRGRISGHGPLKPDLAAKRPLAPRRALAERQGRSPVFQIRLVDYFEISDVNEMLPAAGKCAPHGIDARLSIPTY